MNHQHADQIRKNLRMMAMKCGLPSDATLGAKGVITPNFKAIKEPNTGRDEYIAIATTEDIDLDEEVVVSRGLTKTYVERNRQLFCDHQYGMGDVVGAIRQIKAYPDQTDQRGWKVRISLNDTLMGQTTRKIIEDSGQIGLSIGFRALDYGPPTDEERARYTQGGKQPKAIVRSGDWFELSATPLPCNVSCQTGQVVRADEKRAADLVEMVRVGKIDREIAAMLGIPVEPKRKLWAVDIESGIQTPIMGAKK
jgi:hypothetical protein